MNFKWFSKTRAKLSEFFRGPSPDDLFANAYPVMLREFHRKFRARMTELSHLRASLAATADFQKLVNPFAKRALLYEEYLDHIQQDFVSCIQDILIPHCDKLLPHHLQQVQSELHAILNNQLGLAKQAEEAFAASIGRSNSQNLLRPIESMFRSAGSKNRGLIDSIFAQANLRSERERLEARKKTVTELRAEIVKWAITGGGIVLLVSLILKALGLI